MAFYSAYKQLSHSLLVAPGFTSCTTQSNTEISATALLIAKYQVLNEEISPHHTKCSGIVEEFLQASPYTCSFKVQELEFDIENKYVVDSTGRLQKFYTYLAEGPVIYNLKELSEDSAFVRYENLDKFHIAFADDNQSIIDGNDTVGIERVFPLGKLIMARRNAHLMRGRRFIYQYQ